MAMQMTFLLVQRTLLRKPVQQPKTRLQLTATLQEKNVHYSLTQLQMKLMPVALTLLPSEHLRQVCLQDELKANAVEPQGS